MKRTVLGVFSPVEVAAVLATHVVVGRGIELVPGSVMETKLLAVFVKDAEGMPAVSQFRVEAEVDEVEESWKG